MEKHSYSKVFIQISMLLFRQKNEELWQSPLFWKIIIFLSPTLTLLPTLSLSKYL